MRGYIFNDNNHCWAYSYFPYPDVVYNRIPTREDESQSITQACLKNFGSHNIPFFNVGFLDKWEMYECLLGDPELRVFLPETRLLTRYSLQAALEKWGTVYLKPRAGQKGEGIQTASVKENGAIWHRTYGENHEFTSFIKMWDAVGPDFAGIPYLIQPQILLDRHKGRAYDFRLIVQKTAGEWRLTGAGARLAAENAITTHVPRGGELLALTAIHPPPDLALLTKLVTNGAMRLESQFSPLAELSFDIGRDVAGQYWLFEANAKPMEFDETEIETKRMLRLIDIFYEKSGFEKHT
ncbi:MAG TPA: YheC/YheD family protein [Bacillales bacterium]|nr:YheC/YheD family protein [Bacillales bacterium]